MRTESGYITQNNYWISLKTRIYSNRISFHQKLANELADFLTANGFEFDADSFEVDFANNSNSRLGCVTVKVSGKAESLPFERDAIN